MRRLMVPVQKKCSIWSLLAALSVVGLIAVNLILMFRHNDESNTAAKLPLSRGIDSVSVTLNSASFMNEQLSVQIKPPPNTTAYRDTQSISKEIQSDQSKVTNSSIDRNKNTAEWSWNLDYTPVMCSKAIVDELAKPRLEGDKLMFCKWALDPQGGRVVVGKSWGSLAHSKSDKEKFDALNCNAVAVGKNPSCDDSWGDKHIYYWRNSTSDRLVCETGRKSDVRCLQNDNSDLLCVLSNAVIDFSKVVKVNRGTGMTPSRKFQQDFLSVDCKDHHDKSMSQAFPFSHLFSSKMSSGPCDVYYNDTLLLYSHDDIRNIGHTMNDIMNVWIMLWVTGLTKHSKALDLLNVDSFKLGHNFDDEPNRFFQTYLQNFNSIIKGTQYPNKRLCVKELVMQPNPPRFFIWESWFVDLPCSFVGPSSLYQRWNYHVRHSYGLLKKPNISKQSKGIVLLVIRNEKTNMWGAQRTSRNFLNTPEIEKGLQDLISTRFARDYEFIAQDLARLSFFEQIKLMGKSSLVIGMHGAGLSSTMHMSVGNEKCCGMVELFPAGEFSPIRGHGNMARKMGIHYDRLDIKVKDSHSEGAKVPVKNLLPIVEKMLKELTVRPSCIHPDVLSNPFFDGQ